MARLELREPLTDAPITWQYLDNFLYGGVGFLDVSQRGEWFRVRADDLNLIESILAQVLLHLKMQEGIEEHVNF